MRILVLAESWPSGTSSQLPAAEVARVVRTAWSAASASATLDCIAVGDGGPRTADALAGERIAVGGAHAVEYAGTLVLAPARSALRWEPPALAAALLGLAAEHARAVPARTVVVPVGDEPPAGDATDLWSGGLAAMRAGVEALDLVAAVSTQRPLLGFHGMSAALRDGRESDQAIAAAAQQQEQRWTAIAQEVDAQAGERSLLGPARLSDAPGSGAAGGLAYCLAAIGARLMPAAPLIASMSGADDAAEHADLVVAVAGALVPRTLDEGVVPAASALAARRGLPAVVLAPDARVGRRDLMNAGLSAAHQAEPGAEGLASGVQRLAQTWTPRS